MSPRPQKPEPPSANPADMDAISLVLHTKRHWTAGKTRRRYDCRCEECHAVNRVVALARKAVEADVVRRRQAFLRIHLT